MGCFHYQQVFLIADLHFLTAQKLDALDYVAVLSILLSAGINATTIQAQDFKDVHGDAAIGRRTLPIILPGIARYTILAGLTAWSIGLAWVWKLDWATAFIFLSIAGVVVSRFQFLTSVKEDQVSYYWYNVSAGRVVCLLRPELMNFEDLAFFRPRTSVVLSPLAYIEQLFVGTCKSSPSY